MRRHHLEESPVPEKALHLLSLRTKSSFSEDSVKTDSMTLEQSTLSSVIERVILGAKEWSWEYIDCDIFVPMQRFGHSMISFCDKLFVFGGGKTVLK